MIVLTFTKGWAMIGLIVLGVVVGASGLGLVGTFGILSFLGVPLLAIGLALISAGVGPVDRPRPS
jgi:hypothetical protein